MNEKTVEKNSRYNLKEKFFASYEMSKTALFFAILTLFSYILLFGGRIYIEYGNAITITGDFFDSLFSFLGFK